MWVINKNRQNSQKGCQHDEKGPKITNFGTLKGQGPPPPQVSLYAYFQLSYD